MTSVLSCIENNNVRILKLLVTVPGSVPQSELEKSLVLAVQRSLPECVQALLDVGVQPDIECTHGSTLLMLAAANGYTEVVEKLLAGGADINSMNHGGATALHQAARVGKHTIVDLLLKSGASVNVQDSSGSTPLISVARHCHRALDVVRRLVEAKCDLDLQDKEGKCALHYTAHKAVGAELLLSAGAASDIQDCDGNTPLLLAATEGFDNIVDCLMTYQANPDLKNSCGKAPIHFLAMKNHWQGIDAIAHHHGNVDIMDDSNTIPLWYAVNHNRPEAVKALLRANCCTDPPERDGSSEDSHVPLQTALDKSLYGIAKLLVLAGCDLVPLYDWLTRMEQRQASTPQRLSLFVEEEEEQEEDEEEVEALEWFEDWVHTPHSLRQICRIYIRQLIGAGLLRKGDSLPLPPSLRDYVVLKEVEDHHIEGYLM